MLWYPPTQKSKDFSLTIFDPNQNLNSNQTPESWDLLEVWCQDCRTCTELDVKCSEQLDMGGHLFYYTGAAMIIWWLCQTFNCWTPFLTIKPRQRKALIQRRVNVVVLDQSQNRTKVPWVQSTRMSACQRLCWDSPDILGALCSPIDSIVVSLFKNSCHNPSDSWIGRRQCNLHTNFATVGTRDASE